MRGAVSVLVLVTCLVAGCSSAEGPRRTANAGPLVPDLTQGARHVELALTVQEGEQPDGPRRQMLVRWVEEFIRRPETGEVDLILLPQGAVQTHGPPESPGSVSLPCPRRILCSRDPARPPSQGLMVAVEPPDPPRQQPDREQWLAILQSCLFFEELAYLALPHEDAAQQDEWRIDLDADGFARRTRLGAWAEDGIRIKGMAGYLREEEASNVRKVRGVFEVRRGAGQVLQLQVDVSFDPAVRDIDSATIVGVSGGDPGADAMPPTGVIRLQMRRTYDLNDGKK